MCLESFLSHESIRYIVCFPCHHWCKYCQHFRTRGPSPPAANTLLTFPSALQSHPLQSSSDLCPPPRSQTTATCLNFCYGNSSPLGTKKFSLIYCCETNHPQNWSPKNSIQMFSLSWFLWIQHSGSACLGGSGSRSQMLLGLGPTQRLLCSHIWPIGWEDLHGWGWDCWVSVVPLCSFSSMGVSLLQGNIPQEREPGRCCVTFDELAFKAY